MISVKVDSAKALAELKLMEESIQVKGVQAALRRPGSLAARTMRQLVPIDRGDMKAAITARQLSRRAGDRIDAFDSKVASAAVLIGPNKRVKRGRSQAGLSLLVESGTRPHMISPKHGLYLRFGKWGEVAKGSVQHPGARPKPFMQRTLDSTFGSFEELFYQGLQAWLDKKNAASLPDEIA